MSANNELLIIRKQNGLYKLRDVDFDTEGGFDIADDIDGLGNALVKAEDYMQENVVEYGYRIIN